ncbi:GIY-YIG nuclease family protein [Sulfitobacter sp. F26169L]|uniref:GIY-YIG nuclease family protein n=1 Tax=Sulfitobacter sp. F26169L TaxID=2996015 RepID=UPI002260FE87|nr:GIY-YIG nuclease family protein [Sulfitobacter sp. F26169L]MCX7568068.1 GIY-YIG nuclease family protein [Sulfitobacter sp. F26169L]
MNMHSNTPATMTINNFRLPIHTGAIKPGWLHEAQKKGFTLVARVVDRMHLAVQCHLCGHLSVTRLFTLMSAQPLCPQCIEQAWRTDAAQAGLEFIGRDPDHRHYGIYKMSCGHEVRRQFALIKRVALAATGLRCETCHAKTEAREAHARGWELLGPDPQGDLNYRKYRHTDCGHVQRIARANMQSGRFGCGGCGVDWPAAPSFLYAMHFTLENGREIVKAGFSRDPQSRLHHQLKRDPSMPCTLLHMVAVPTGQDAIRLEKRLHADLKHAHPASVIDPAVYSKQIRVASEIYDGALTPIVLARLEEIEAEIARIPA